MWEAAERSFHTLCSLFPPPFFFCFVFPPRFEQPTKIRRVLSGVGVSPPLTKALRIWYFEVPARFASGKGARPKMEAKSPFSYWCTASFTTRFRDDVILSGVFFSFFFFCKQTKKKLVGVSCLSFMHGMALA